MQVEGEKYRVQTDRKRPLMTLDGTFKKRLRAVIRNHMLETQSGFVLEQVRALEAEWRELTSVVKAGRPFYRDRERSVVCGRDGSIFCCQEVPPFVVEGADRKFRRFDGVRVGVRLCSLEPQEVLSEGGAYVMQRFDHPFVFGYGDEGRLCMGHDYDFFQRFWQMPLEEGIVEYLNAARLVLCAGYFEAPGAPPFVPDEMTKRPVIGLRKARKQKLPVYRYYRET